jgi:peptide/nickel transport system permease protein
MARYAARRLAQSIPTVFILSVVIFVLMRMIPGNISDVILADAGGTAQERAEQKLVIERELGIAEPGVTQYVKWVGGVLRGDFGRSLWDGTSVSSDVARRARVSGWLAAWIAITASAFAVPLGIVAAACRSKSAVVTCRRSLNPDMQLSPHPAPRVSP